jgi:hypothetical protein
MSIGASSVMQSGCGEPEASSTAQPSIRRDNEIIRVEEQYLLPMWFSTSFWALMRLANSPAIMGVE